MLLMIDNYDSFTYNLVQYFRELGVDVQVYRNDEISIADIEKLAPSHLVISPGPCTPDEAGVSMEVVAAFSGAIPILGICLGHQCIAQVFGGDVLRAKQVMHGKTSYIYHQGTSVFTGLPSPQLATRYHSLIVSPEILPECLEATAWSHDTEGNKDEIMGIRHKVLSVEGVQFHPESILTEAGHALLANFLTR
ncbi:aminodeoxychorismate/anthranilate synthase component II [Marinomonas sp.]|nr:aminodeoxychorismate/anthranilate synthase component II [Marinomonas sp.]MDB4837978.1 aminodeoxychorismate/anthranilate synthase component II [Marinomonas sp.]